MCINISKFSLFFHCMVFKIASMLCLLSFLNFQFKIFTFKCPINISLRIKIKLDFLLFLEKIRRLSLFDFYFVITRSHT